MTIQSGGIGGSGQTGSILITTLLCLTLLLSFAGLTIGTAQFYTTVAEVQNCADAGALAGAQLLDGDHTGATAAANELIEKNGCEVVSAEIGWFDSSTFTTGSYPTLDWPASDADIAGPWTGAVHVTASKALVPVFGSDLITVQRSAIGRRHIIQDADTLLWDLGKGSRLVR